MNDLRTVKEEILNKCKDKIKFYMIIGNNFPAIMNFRDSDSMWYYNLIFNNGFLGYKDKTWCDLRTIDYSPLEREEIFKNYLQGAYQFRPKYVYNPYYLQHLLPLKEIVFPNIQPYESRVLRIPLIDLPESLYLIELLEQGMLDDLTDPIVIEHLKSLDSKIFDEINIDGLQKMLNSKIGLKNIDIDLQDGRVLKKIKN